MHDIFNYLGLIVLYILIACGGLLFFRKAFRLQVQKESNEYVMMIFGIGGTLYSLVLAFVVFAVWQDYEELDTVITDEVNSLANIYSCSNVLPVSYQNVVKTAVINYTASVPGDEWPALEKNTESEKTLLSFYELRKTILNLHSGLHQKDEHLFNTLYSLYLKLSNERRKRISENTSHLPFMVWFVLISGSLVVIVITFFFSHANLSRQLALNALMAVLFALVHHLCYALDHPFQGQVKVKSKPYIELLNHFKLASTYHI